MISGYIGPHFFPNWSEHYNYFHASLYKKC
jgi:hypothetical protein